MTRRYKYELSGTASRGQTWSCRGFVECELGEVLHLSMRETFISLTEGKRVEFGKPELGCGGPYAIDRVVIELMKE